MAITPKFYLAVAGCWITTLQAHNSKRNLGRTGNPATLGVSKVTFKKSWLLAASAVALTCQGQAQAATIVSNSYGVANVARGSLVNNAGFRFEPFNNVFNVNVDATVSRFGLTAGARAFANIGASLKFSGNV